MLKHMDTMHYKIPTILDITKECVLYNGKNVILHKQAILVF